MISDFNDNGYLPAGIHTAHFQEVAKRFGGSKSLKRSELTNHLKDFYNFIKFHSFCIYIDGSYITSKLSPKDVDIIVVLKPQFMFNEQAKQRLHYFSKSHKLHIIPFIHGIHDQKIQEIIDFFSADRQGRPKGIIQVETNK